MASEGVRLSRERTEGSMQVRIMLQIVGDDGAVGDLEDVASLTKITEGAEDLGLSLAESKTLLAAAQQRIVKAQVDCWLERHRHCPISGRKLRCKGSYPVTFRIRDWRDRKRNFERSSAGPCPKRGRLGTSALSTAMIASRSAGSLTISVGRAFRPIRI
jgi:hypothetical protein